MTHFFKFKLGIYPFTVYVCVGRDVEFFKKKLRKKMDEIGMKNFEDINLDTDDGQADFSYDNAIIWCKQFPNNPKALATLNHEIFHIVHRALETVGMPLDNSSREAYAYLTGYISEQIYKQLNLFK